MTNKTVDTTVELLGRPYPIRCPESELQSLQQAAEYLNKKMAEVQEAGKVASLERIVIITALNIAHQLLQGDQQKTSLMSKINQRISTLQDKLDSAISKPMQTELLYTTE